MQEGRQTHTGLELSARGRVGDNLQLSASASVLQARARGTGTPAYEGHPLINVPTTRASVHADCTLAGVHVLNPARVSPAQFLASI